MKLCETESRFQPIATGVSTYGAAYNWLFLNNGYHAEHHHQPKAHWTIMKAVRAESREAQEAAGVRTIRWAHPLGFLDPAWRQVPTARRPRVRAA
jgi:fatty acid desaturase